ncbi:murein biosynthesis integral membrane protein MurJ [Neorhizobium alkalisoli]|uniref:Putative peptidoglycan lipid II flippase n=1 Tax=Neorhizobium alkalisoli TaxID=528178 RepID=A0A561R6N4_9HYPH|nr:lipid II flippase MurJ [Neorhizobium alkalisoli]TWF58265.1 putative peptidoglycan lipid II flippase [Neorhizobium alkalisoli]
MTGQSPPETPGDQAELDRTKERPSVQKIAAFLMSGALLSKGLGFVREIIMAQIIGIAAVADGFRTSITLVLLPLAFLQNESVPAILIPMMQEAQRRGDGPRRLATITAALTLIGFVLMLLTMIFGHFLVSTMVGGLAPDAQDVTLHFLIIMALSMPASVAINCYAAGEIVLGKTRITNLRASILNIGVIAGLGMLVLTQYVMVLAWSFTLAFNALALWGTMVLWREGNLSVTGLRMRWIVSEGIEFVRRLRPFLPLPAAEQGNIWLERLLASRLTTGAIASLDYARTLTDSALLLISQPIGLAVLSGSSQKTIDEQAEIIARYVLAVALPMSAFVFVFAEDIVRIVFHRGAFGEGGVFLTSQALRGISIGLWASTLGWILLRLLNSSQRNVRAAVILVLAYAVNFSLNYATSGLQQSSGFGVLILGLGETCRSLVLLGGVMLALQCRGRLLGLIAIACVPAAVMLGIGAGVLEVLQGSFVRLLLGGIGLLFVLLMSFWMLTPWVVGRIVARLLRSKRGKEHDA